MIKRILFMALACVLCAGAAEAKPKKFAKDLYWEVTPDSVLVISGYGNMPDWAAPQQEAWYKNPKVWRSIKAIEVQDGIVSIGFKSFSPFGPEYRRSTPLRVSLPGSLQAIGDFAFKGTLINSITLPEGLRQIGIGAFIGSVRQGTLDLPRSLVTIDEGAFQRCDIITVNFASDVVVAQGAFFECPPLRAVNFNDTWTELAGASFEGDHQLVELLASDNVRVTGGNPFIRTPLEKSPVVAHMSNPVSIDRALAHTDGGDARSENGEDAAQAAPVVVSELDRNIPVMDGINRDNTFALIIGNENYRREAAVPFANNDAAIFGEYLTKTLGIPQQNVTLIKDASLNDMKYGLNTLARLSNAFEGNVNFIVYYAGHGVPDESTRDAFLLPVDGYGADSSTGYPISALYKRLGTIPSNGTVLFMDACFSGSKREGDMLASARGVTLVPKEAHAVGNLVVLSAASGDETAFAYNEEGHGMFTYYLLKKLQQNMGDVSLGELADYVIGEVKKSAIVINKKPQTPSVMAADEMGDTWRDIKL